jgi:hypothetical protein
MGVGMPEYVLLFRKPPTDASDGYADERVVKTKDDYSRARWQIDAHASGARTAIGCWRRRISSLVPDDEVFKRFRAFNVHVYDYEHHVAIGEALRPREAVAAWLQLIPSATRRHPDVWSDVMRARTLNGAQYAKGARCISVRCSSTSSID